MAQPPALEVDLTARVMPATEHWREIDQLREQDPRQFPNPAEVDFDRFPNRHVAFATSEYRCPGSHLARKELQAAVAERHRLIPDCRTEGDIPAAHGGTISLMARPRA